MSGTEPPWVVLRVRPQYLARAEDNVRRQGAEFYAPHAMLRSERSRYLSRRPLFPGYAFARHPDGRWVFLRGTFGVVEVIMGARVRAADSDDEQPARLPHAEVARLRAREGPDGLVRVEAREFEMGEHVRVEKGAVSLDAIVDGMSGQDRVFVLLQVLGGARTAIDVRDVWRL